MLRATKLLCVAATLYCSGVAAFAPLGRPAFTTSRRLQAKEFALLFDCDGVILETEELHRLAYNEAFRKFDLTIGGEPVVWSVSNCDICFCTP